MSGGELGETGRCYVCDEQKYRSVLAKGPLHVENYDGPGYQGVQLPICRGRRLERWGVTFGTCGRVWMDGEAVVHC